MTLSLFLALMLAASLLAWARREKHWTKRWETVARSLGLRARDADLLPTYAPSVVLARQHAEQQAEQRRVFETLLDEISQGLVLVDENLRIRYANAPLKKLLHRKDIHAGRPLIAEVRDHQISDLVQESITEKRHTTRRIQMLPSDVGAGANLGGRYFIIEAAPLAADVGGGAWLMIQDVTESAMTEQIRRDFVANASHELRTPLTLINGYIEMLQDDATTSKVPAAMKRSLDVMEKHGKRIARIIEDMLAISRLEDASSSLNKEPFNVKACAKDAADHLAPMLEGRDTRIEFSFPKDGGQLTGDRFYWDQVFTNLIENSIKENTKPGLVIRVTGEWLENECILKVSDNGIGIPAHDLPFVFKRFYRGNKHHSSTQVKGTGLGLSIVKRAVEAHGGTIELTSSPGIETTFTMRLPLQPA
ncbi:sensor histidine kinase [Prosthecobacter sp.]|uniref:sensor histidine kinase n=1 Tax=Prosthecobacter sp. TaxID=1965333 RepID=UPI0037850DAB